MKRPSIAAVFVVFALLIAFSCENGGTFGVNCKECYSVEPDSADLIVYLTINSENPYVPLKIYRGDVEKKELDWVDTAFAKEYRLYSAVNQQYSIEATYHNGSKQIIAIDGDKITANLVTDVCDDDCWILKGGILDARIKDK